jgi:hypothetical protein
MDDNENTPVQQQIVADIPVQSLKGRFQARSIPLENDFADLIDVADCGRRAAGLSPDVTRAPDTGLTLDSTTGQLKVLPEPEKGIVVGSGGIAVLPNAARGIMVDGSGIGVNCDRTLNITTNNQLAVSDNAFERQKTFLDLTIPNVTCLKIGVIKSDVLNAYAHLHIVGYDTSGQYNYHQRFIVTLTSDGNIGVNKRNYALSVENAITSEGNYSFATVRLAKESNGDVILYLEATHTRTSMRVGLDYAKSDISDIEIISFETIPTPSSPLCSLNVRVDGTIRGDGVTSWA